MEYMRHESRSRVLFGKVKGTRKRLLGEARVHHREEGKEMP